MIRRLSEVPGDLADAYEVALYEGLLHGFEMPDSDPCLYLTDKGRAWLAESSEADDQWSEAKSPSDWCKELEKSLTTLKRWGKEGKLVIDKVGLQLWRIRLDTLARLKGDK